MSTTENQAAGNFPLAFGASGVTLAGHHKYPNPFCDMASEYVPSDIINILDFCEYIYLTNGTYRSASRRVIRYFLTEVVLDGESDKEREKYKNFFDTELHLLNQLAEIGDEYSTYGNVFISILFPFKRFMRCPECGISIDIEKMSYKFDRRATTFSGKCLKCGYEGVYEIKDYRDPATAKVKLIRWNPKRMRLRVHPITTEVRYYYEIDPLFISKLDKGDEFLLNTTPMALLKACANSDRSNARMFEFNKESIYHLKEPTLAGILVKGWGIPPILPNFKLAYYIQLLRRYDEAIALDFIIPFRILYPNLAPGGSDPLQQMNMQNFMSHMHNMVEQKRKNITDIQVAPFPVGYQAVGGEGRDLAPKDSIAFATDELLNAVGFPAELYKATLSIQAFPVALRLFEKTWGTVVDGFNDLIMWIIKRISRHYMWGPITGKLRSVTLADDIERKALALQAAAGMDISKATAYRPLGIDYNEEQKRIIEEQETVAKLQEEAMERQGREREPRWTESIAVGNEVFVRETKEKLGIRAMGREVIGA